MPKSLALLIAGKILVCRIHPLKVYRLGVALEELQLSEGEQVVELLLKLRNGGRASQRERRVHSASSFSSSSATPSSGLAASSVVPVSKLNTRAAFLSEAAEALEADAVALASA